MPSWAYLCSEPFQSRYAVAAWALRGLPLVIEIGGYKTPIDGFVGPGVRVLSIDPLCDPLEDGRVRRLTIDYRDFDFGPFLGLDYGLAMLGFDLPITPKLLGLIAGARKIVIEYPDDGLWLDGRRAFEQLRPALKICWRLELNLADNDFGDLRGSWPARVRRLLYVCEPA